MGGNSLEKDIDLLHNPFLKRILHALEGLEYGTIQITVHDSKITQIDRTEKHRFHVEKIESNEERSNRSIKNKW